MGEIIIKTEGDKLMRDNSEFVKEQSERISKLADDGYIWKDMDTATINRLSERGLIFRSADGKPVYGKLYDIGTESFKNRIMKGYTNMGKAEGMLQMYVAGKNEGWLKPRFTAKGGKFI